MLAVKYTLFAAFATLLNLCSQFISLELYDKFGALIIAMLIGTFVGLVTKYVLDKRYIFQYVTKDKKEDMGKFLLYSFIGVGTTIIFWVTELMFDQLWNHASAKYVGAVLGLSVGYIIKYHMDKRYVFVSN